MKPRSSGCSPLRRPSARTLIAPEVAVPDRSLEAACRECGRSLTRERGEAGPVRCGPCFEAYLRGIDLDFLASYGELGVTSRRTVAETCLRSLVLEQPPARKVLAVAIMEQFLLASGDLIGLHYAVKGRHRQPIVRAFLSFRPDAEAFGVFFAEVQEASDEELLAALGLPTPERAPARYPGLDARSLTDTLESLLRDLRTTGQRSASALLLGESAGGFLDARTGLALAETSSWLGGGELRPDQVASLALDERRRQLVVQAMPVEEHRLGEVVDAIDCMARASANLIYAYLTVQDEEARLRARPP